MRVDFTNVSNPVGLGGIYIHNPHRFDFQRECRWVFRVEVINHANVVNLHVEAVFRNLQADGSGLGILCPLRLIPLGILCANGRIQLPEAHGLNRIHIRLPFAELVGRIDNGWLRGHFRRCFHGLGGRFGSYSGGLRRCGRTATGRQAQKYPNGYFSICG